MANTEPPDQPPPANWTPPPGWQPLDSSEQPRGATWPAPEYGTSPPSGGLYGTPSHTGQQYGPPSAGQQHAYPQQTLLPQEVRSGRSRKPLLIGALAVVLLIIGGVVAWQLLKDDGEDTRAAYCSALKDLTNNGDIMTALSTADASSLGRIQRVVQLAPDAVRDDWDTLQSLVSSSQTGQGNIDVSLALKAFGAFRAISDDAQSKCSITMDVPGLP